MNFRSNMDLFHAVIFAHSNGSFRKKEGVFRCDQLSDQFSDFILSNFFPQLDASSEVSAILSGVEVPMSDVNTHHVRALGERPLIIQIRGARSRSKEKEDMPPMELKVNFQCAGSVVNMYDGSEWNGPQTESTVRLSRESSLSDLYEQTAGVLRLTPQAIYLGSWPGAAWPFDFTEILDHRRLCQLELRAELGKLPDRSEDPEHGLSSKIPQDIIDLIVGFTPSSLGWANNFESQYFEDSNLLSGSLPLNPFLRERGFFQGSEHTIYAWPREIKVDLIIGVAAAPRELERLFAAKVPFPSGRLFHIENFMWVASGEGYNSGREVQEAAELRNSDLQITVNGSVVVDSRKCLGQLCDLNEGRCVVRVSLAGPGDVISSTSASRRISEDLVEAIHWDRGESSSAHPPRYVHGLLNVDVRPFNGNLSYDSD